MAILIVDNRGRYTVTTLYQWDRNQYLKISGLTFSNIPEIHFSNKAMSEAFVRQCQVDDEGTITVNIPNAILEIPLPIDIYVCSYEGEMFRTLYALQIPVKARTKPSDYIYEQEYEVLSFNALHNRLTNSIVEMQALVDNAVDTVNKKYTDTYNSLVIKCDETLAELDRRCQSYLADLKAQNNASLQTLNKKCDDTLLALTQAFNERVENLRAEVVGDDVLSLESKLTGLITVLNNISIAPSAWSNKTYTISSDKITTNSIIDIYYASTSKSVMSDAEPSYTISAGKVVISVVTVPTSTVVIDCVKVVNDV